MSEDAISPSPSDSFAAFFSEARYTVGDVAAVLGVSRTTLVWYEDIGVIAPARAEGTGWRMYSAQDIYRLMGALALKNAGVRPTKMANQLTDNPFSSENIEKYIRYSELREEYYRAQAECFRKLDGILKHVGSPMVMDVEPHYITFDDSEGGYKDYSDDAVLSKLVSCMPVASLGALAQEDWPSHSSRWGRAVPVRFSHLVETFSQNRQIIGGMKCLCLPSVYSPFEQGSSQLFINIMQDYIDKHGLRVTGRCFCPFIFPANGSFCSLYCLPVSGK